MYLPASQGLRKISGVFILWIYCLTIWRDTNVPDCVDVRAGTCTIGALDASSLIRLIPIRLIVRHYHFQKCVVGFLCCVVFRFLFLVRFFGNNDSREVLCSLTRCRGRNLDIWASSAWSENSFFKFVLFLVQLLTPNLHSDSQNT